MAEVIETATVTTKESIAEVRLETPASLDPDDWGLNIRFETCDYNADGSLRPATSRVLRAVSRKFGAIHNDSYTAAGATVTATQLAALIQTACYRYRAEDIAAAEQQ